MKTIYTTHNFAKRLVMMLAVGVFAVNVWGATYTYDFHSCTASSGGAMTYWYSDAGCNTQLSKFTSGTTNQIISSEGTATIYYKDASIPSTAFTISAGNTAYFMSGSSASTAFFWGKTAGNYITLPTYSGEVITKVKVTTSSSVGKSIEVNIYSGTYAASTSYTTTGCTPNGCDNTQYNEFTISDTYQASSLKLQIVTDNKNFQITEIQITTASACDKKVTVSNGGSSTNGTITSITTSPVATCSSTASDRQVSILVTPSTGYVAPTDLSVGSTTGTVTSSKISRTDNGNGTFTFVYGYNQNDNGTISYNAACVGKQCTVTFDKNSGTGGDNSVTATYGSAMTDITPPTREHFDFDGYYDSETDNDGTGNKYYNADGSSAATWNKNTTSNTTLYAKWTEHGLTNYRTVCSSTYNVTYDGNGNTDGSVPTDNTDYDSGDEVTVLGNSGSLVKTHYAFDGWNTKADGSGDPYAEDETFEITKNTTLYAQWACDENITISAGTPTNGSFTLSSTGDVETCSDDVVITVTPSPNTGYNFSAITQTGLNSGVTINQSDKTVTYDQYSSGTTTINVTFVAKTTTVTLNKNGATSGTNQTVSATYGLAMPTTTTSSAALVAPTKNGYTLMGYWDTDATTGGKQYYDANMTSVTSWDKEDATVTLYARWEAKVDRFIDDMHETSGYTSAAPHEESGASYTMPGPLSNTTPGGDCVTAHYIFVGWVLSTGQNSNGTLKDSGSRIYRPGETIHATNATYYAVWAEE